MATTIKKRISDESVPVQIKIPKKLKQDADELFRSIGTNTNDVIRMCLTISVARREIPFKLEEPRDINDFTREQLQRILQAKAEIDAGKSEVHDLIETD